jgi:hypothetical protein
MLATVQAQITAADQKAAALLTISGVLIAFPTPSILLPPQPSEVPPFAAVLATIAACGFVTSVLATLMVLFPRTTNRSDTSSLTFFGDIASGSQKHYSEAIQRADEKRIRDDLIAQLYVNSTIAGSKYGHFKWAVRALVSGILFLVFSYAVVAYYGKKQPPSPPQQLQQSKST